MAAKQKVDNIKGVFSNLFSGKDSHQHPQHTPEGDAAVEQSLGTTSAPSQQLPSGSGASGIDLQAARAKLQQLREAVHQAQAVLTQAETELGVAQHDAQQSGAAVFDWVLGLLKEPSDISLRLDGAEASAAVVGRDVSSSNGRSGGSVMVADRPSSTSAPSQLPGSIDALVEWAQTEFMCDRLRPECDKCGQVRDHRGLAVCAKNFGMNRPTQTTCESQDVEDDAIPAITGSLAGGGCGSLHGQAARAHRESP
jgi:hypothetical protein